MTTGTQLPHLLPRIEAYCWPLSAVAGDSISVYLSSPGRPDAAVAYEVVRRTRTSDPDGELVARESVPGTVPSYPVPEDASTHGCRWPSAFNLTVEEGWISSYYELRFRFADGTASSPHSRCFFVVRPSGAKRAKILLAIASNTYCAYNDHLGKNVYEGPTQSSWLRPWAAGLLFKPRGQPGRRVALLDPSGTDVDMRTHVRYLRSNGLTSWGGSAGFPNYEEDFTQWLHREGFDADFCTNADLEFHPEVLEGKSLYLSVGHDEYWSKGMRDTVEGFIARGGNVAFFSGNTSYWQVRLEGEPLNGADGTTMIAYKQQWEKDPILKEPGKQHLVTSIWSDTLIGRPENHMTGVSFVRGGYSRIRRRVPKGSAGYRIYRPEHWVFEGTRLEYGDELGAAATIVGYECDGVAMRIGKDGRPEPTGEDGTPASFKILGLAPAAPFTHATAARPVAVGTRDEVEHNSWRTGIPVEQISYNHAVFGTWTHASGGVVVTSGCTDWPCAVGVGDETVDRVTRNIIGKLSGAGSGSKL
ncbi:hypothetical protein DFJ74DRAFT_759737 [Hyaloraphidium curvatum]|nr:hypothetical protein DFJ74DRAFT_759737 [Hyaloraphidium curvatum]